MPLNGDARQGSERSGLGLLTFSDVTLERAFRQQYWERALPVSRFGVVSAAVLWVAFGYLDVLVGRDTLMQLWTIRFLVGLPPFVVAVALSYFGDIRRRFHLVLTPSATICGFCIIAMVAVSEPPTSDYYYAGIMIVLFFSYTFIQLPFVYASFTGILCLAAYECVAISMTHSPSEVIVNNTYFLVATNYVGMFASYSLERYRRRSFLQIRIIEEERQKLADLTAQLEDLSVHDPLTGLYNRRQLDRHVREAVDLHRRSGTTAAVMLIDLDDFKAINDRFGHLAGDELLRRSADLILATVRKTDLAFRFGGDEFVVLLGNTGEREAEQFAGRLVEAFARHTAEAEQFVTLCGVSVGVAAIDANTASPEALLGAADRALYQAKQSGKGRVAVSGVSG